jgi:hypothetical protein
MQQQQQQPISVQPVILCKSQEQVVTGNNPPHTNNVGVPMFSNEMHSGHFVPQPIKTIVHPLKNTVTEQDSLFSNQDPWKTIGGNSNQVPPIPTRLANNNGTTRDLAVENNVGATSRSNIAAPLEESNIPKKGTGPDPVLISKGNAKISCLL